jgi:hypothetical protein
MVKVKIYRSGHKDFKRVRNPLAVHKDLAAKIHKDPVKPLDMKDWPKGLR